MTRPHVHTDGDTDGDTGRQNMIQLVQLRWLAVGGQVITIAAVSGLMHVRLPVGPMAVVLIGLITLNVVSLLLLRRPAGVAKMELFTALVIDVAALGVQLYFTGGSANPFIWLFLLQVVLGAVLLEGWLPWALVALTSLAFAVLMLANRRLALPAPLAANPFGLYVDGAWVCFGLVAVLFVLFVTRVTRNLRARDLYVAAMRQRATEEDHIVRMGLLASGAAHELGTPLAQLSVILGDWRRMPRLSADPELAQEIGDMQAAVARCKAIVTGILLSSGEARGEAPDMTTVRAFLSDVVETWRATHPSVAVDYLDLFGRDLAIVSDTALKQMVFNVLDNAADASPDWIGLIAERRDEALIVSVRDRGAGFAPETLENLGRPYNSSKGRAGGGLGLFLVFNVMRKLGGRVEAKNAVEGGAVVSLVLPLATLAVTQEDERDGP